MGTNTSLLDPNTILLSFLAIVRRNMTKST